MRMTALTHNKYSKINKLNYGYLSPITCGYMQRYICYKLLYSTNFVRAILEFFERSSRVRAEHGEMAVCPPCLVVSTLNTVLECCAPQCIDLSWSARIARWSNNRRLAGGRGALEYSDGCCRRARLWCRVECRLGANSSRGAARRSLFDARCLLNRGASERNETERNGTERSGAAAWNCESEGEGGGSRVWLDATRWLAIAIVLVSYFRNSSRRGNSIRLRD